MRYEKDGVMYSQNDIMAANPSTSFPDTWASYVPDGYVAAPDAPVIPRSVTRRQFKQGLTRLALRDPVEAWIPTQDKDTIDWYAESNDFERNNPVLLAAATHFGLTPEQVDAAFQMMATL